MSGSITQKFREVRDMKPMIWHPEPNDKKVNMYLDSMNHEPWLAIYAGIIMFVGMFTLLILLGVF
jgi:hypothetical protein